LKSFLFVLASAVSGTYKKPGRFIRKPKFKEINTLSGIDK
jgi:hypothetical protein